MHPIPLSFQHGERHCMPSSSTSSLVSSLPNPSAEALAREHVAQATSEYGFAFL